MTSSVGIVGLNTAAAQQTSASANASSLSVSTTDTTNTSTTSKPLTGGSDSPISPRIVVDPLAGVITQFLSSSGVLQSQIPSAAVVAYLRAGLTPDGFAKQTPGLQDTQKANSAQGGSTSNIVA